MNANDATYRILPAITLSEERFREINKIVDGATAGDPVAEAKLGATDDREFRHWIGLRRARRLSSEAAAKDAARPQQASIPRLPGQLSAPGAAATGPGRVGGDPEPTERVRGQSRIALALATLAAG